MALSARQVVIGKWLVTHRLIVHSTIFYHCLTMNDPGLTLDEAGAVKRELRPCD